MPFHAIVQEVAFAPVHYLQQHIYCCGNFQAPFLGLVALLVRHQTITL